MEILIYQVDAFTSEIFGGNPAAVCLLNQWLDNNILRNIAAENNLAETAFLVKSNDQEYAIRWFTPTVEVDLCGHATLASAFVIFNEMGYGGEKLLFTTKNRGDLLVSRNNHLFTLDFPADQLQPAAIPHELVNTFDTAPIDCFKGKDDYLLVLANEEEVQHYIPDFAILKNIDSRGLIITAKGNTVDFVSRWFGPQVGVPEDPVTGSAHTTLTPYWSRELNKTVLTARQLSKRGGYLECRFAEDRIFLSGEGKLYMRGSIFL